MNKEETTEYYREWRKNNPDKIKQYKIKERSKPGYKKYILEYHKKRYAKDPKFRKKCLESMKRWREKNKDYLKEYRKKYYYEKIKSDPVKWRETLDKINQWKKDNRERVRKYQRKRYHSSDKVKNYQSEYYKKRYAKDPEFREKIKAAVKKYSKSKKGREVRKKYFLNNKKKLYKYHSKYMIKKRIEGKQNG